MKKKVNQDTLIETLHFIFEMYEEWKIEKAKQKAEEAKQKDEKAEKTRQAKQQKAKQEQARQEQARQEQARQEQARQEQARQEQARQQKAKQEQKINLTNSRKILGIKANATEEDIKIAWKNALKKWHPDLFSSKSKEEQDKANEMSKLINTAYQFLKQRISKAS